MDPILRPAVPADAPACGRICYEAFRVIATHHNFPPPLPSPAVATEWLAGMLTHPGFYGVVAEVEGQVVGSNFLAIRQGTATVVEHAGAVAGYATLLGIAGHAVGTSTTALQALIGAASSFSGPGFLLPTRNGELFRWALQHGLRVVSLMTYMSLGLYNEPSGTWLPSVLS
jgi:hypothetical protein